MIVGAAQSTSIDVPASGQLVTPAVNLLPSALTPSTAADRARSLDRRRFAAVDGPERQPGADQWHDRPGLCLRRAGSDPDSEHACRATTSITAGNGNDVIFGDYGIIGALPTTGISQIDAQLQGLSVTMLGLLNQFSALSTVQDAAQRRRRHLDHPVHDLGRQRLHYGRQRQRHRVRRYRRISRARRCVRPRPGLAREQTPLRWIPTCSRCRKSSATCRTWRTRPGCNSSTATAAARSMAATHLLRPRQRHDRRRRRQRPRHRRQRLCHHAGRRYIDTRLGDRSFDRHAAIGRGSSSNSSSLRSTRRWRRTLPPIIRSRPAIAPPLSTC